MEVKPDIIALDATHSLRPGGRTLDEFYREIRKSYPEQLQAVLYRQERQSCGSRQYKRHRNHPSHVFLLFFLGLYYISHYILKYILNYLLTHI